MFRTSSVHHQERFVQGVFADLECGTAVRTTRHVQPLRSNVMSCFSLRRSTDYKQRVYKKHNAEVDSAASSGGQEKYAFLCPHLRQNRQLLRRLPSIPNNKLYKKVSVKVLPTIQWKEYTE